jgi:hypothetical protein
VSTSSPPSRRSLPPAAPTVPVGVEGGIEAGVIAEQPVVPPFAMMSWPAQVLMVPSVRSYRR